MYDTNTTLLVDTNILLIAKMHVNCTHVSDKVDADEVQ
jgi:hypothetical protein